MSDVGSVAEAVSWVGKIVYETLHQSKRELVESAYSRAEKDVRDFACALLDASRGVDGALARAQLQLDGLMFGIKADIAASDAEQLRKISIGKQLDFYDLLGLYARARGAEFCQKVNEIIQMGEQ